MIAKPPATAPPARVLIIKPSALGDVVTAVPVLRGLRRTYPQARISWLLRRSCAPIVEGDDDLDEVIYFERRRLGRAWRSPSAAADLLDFLRDLRRKQFDWVIDLQGLFRSGFFAWASRAPLRVGFADGREGSWLFYTIRHCPAEEHTVDRNLSAARRLGIDASREDMTLRVTAAGREFAERFRRRAAVETGAFLVLVPPTRWATKCYPVRHWRVVADALRRHVPVALLGTRADRAPCQAVADGLGDAVYNLAGETSVPEMVGLIAASAGVVCSDSAAKFIAPAVGVDVVTLIGPTRLERTGPVLGGRALVADVPCQGCLRRRCRHITCMQVIRPEAVIAAAEEMLARAD